MAKKKIKGGRRQIIRKAITKMRYPNPSYYRLPPRVRTGPRSTYAPPAPIAGALLKDGTAYGKHLTAKQMAYFRTLSMRQGNKRAQKKGKR